MIIIENKNKPLSCSSDFIDYFGQQGLDGWGLRGVEHYLYSFSETSVNGLQRSDKICQKSCAVIVPLVQRYPGDRLVQIADPIAEQSCFAETSGSGDEGKFA
jgi:hypothetical protein